MSFLHMEKLYKINHVCHDYKLFSLKCKNNILNLIFIIITVIMFMLTFVSYKCFYCTVINSYMCNILIHTLTPPALSLQGKNITCVSATLRYTHTHIHTHTHPHPHPNMVAHTHKLPQSHWVTRRLYVRLRVWKILDIWSMTGPVSGSFIHWVLFRGFSSMSSNASRVLGLVRPNWTTGFSRMA